MTREVTVTMRKRKAALLIEMTVKRYSDENHVRSDSTSELFPDIFAIMF